MWFACIFSPICSFIFHPLNKVFDTAKIYTFDEVQFIVFPFMGQAFSVKCKNSLSTHESLRLFHFILKCFIGFFFFLHLSSCFCLCLSQLLQHYFFKRLSFPLLSCFHTFVKNQLGLFWRISKICSIDLFVPSFPAPASQC